MGSHCEGHKSQYMKQGFHLVLNQSQTAEATGYTEAVRRT